MENASKALIIAGAILLAIVLISLGMLILGQGEDIVKNNGMNQAEITALNNRFIKYEGEQKGSVVKSIMGEVNAVNADSNLKTNGFGDITVKLGTEIITSTGKIGITDKYKVEITKYENGYVNEITLTKIEKDN